MQGTTRVDDELRSSLLLAYNLKRIADYETGPSAHVSLPRRARECEHPRLYFVRAPKPWMVVLAPTMTGEGGIIGHSPTPLVLAFLQDNRRLFVPRQRDPAPRRQTLGVKTPT